MLTTAWQGRSTQRLSSVRQSNKGNWPGPSTLSTITAGVTRPRNCGDFKLISVPVLAN